MVLKEFISKDVIIGSASIPGLLIVLAFVLFLIWIAILEIYLYRQYTKFKRVERQPQAEPLKKLKPLKERADLRHYLGRIDTLALKSKSQNPKKYLDELYHLVREFTIELLGIGHTYSDDELITILSNNSKDLARLYWHVLGLRQHAETLTNEKMESLLTHFFNLANMHTKKKPSKLIIAKGLFGKLTGMFHKELSPEENRIEELLTKERSVFEANLISVKDTYKKIIALYSKLPYEEKQKLYPGLLDFSHKLSDSLSNSVYGSKAKEELAFFPDELAKIRDVNTGSMIAKVAQLLKQEPAKEEQKIIQALKPAGKPLPAPKAPKEAKILQAPVPSILPQKITELTQVRIKKIDHITRIYRLIEKSRKLWLRKRLKEARSNYDSIKHNFALLSEEEKKEVYPAITSLYYDLAKGIQPKIPKMSIKEDLDAEEQRLRMLLQRRMNTL